ncbi:MAG: type IV toxin-antitoxin system AbiEi family antitoxin domain-containing protein [Actinomycetota bacterium]|nr:type IV toxin-antitoxin system AbiEi family antitoxin domain-containing protein [Actinomycetota bacterium]
MADLAGRQHGIVTAAQIHEVGLDNRAINRRVRERRLTQLHRGVYLVGPGRPTRKGRWLAAALALGDGALLSHRDAAVLWGILEGAGPVVHVTRPGGGRQHRRGIRVHRSRILQPEDITMIDGIPVMALPRTLLDLAAAEPLTKVRRAYEAMERLQLLDHSALLALADRCEGHPGLRNFKRLLAYDPTGAVATREEFERRFHDLIEGSWLPPYQANVVVAGYDVDAYWPEERLVVELQSRKWHLHPTAFERDHAKIARLQSHHFKVLALTYKQVTTQGDWVIETIARLLGITAPASVGVPVAPGRGSKPRRSPKRSRAAGSPIALHRRPGRRG